MDKNLLYFDLQLFSQEAGDASAEASDEAAVSENAVPDSDSEFEELIKGNYKDSFTRRVQGIINERFKTAKETENKLKAAIEAASPLFKKYSLTEGDFQGLKNAVMGENDNAQLSAKEKYLDWKNQEAEIQKLYPAFSLTKAFTENGDFKAMAEAGLPLMQAYKAAYFDEITAGLVAAATRRAAKNTVQSMAGNVRRPIEGGISPMGGTVVKKDVGALTDNDIREIITRVGKGEKISF